MKVGDRVGDRFTLEREIGIGGMSTVYLGRDEVLDRKVAVKILRDGFGGSDDTGVSERFEREGRTAARLSHANVVQVYDAGKDGDENVSYIVMEYVPGGDLKDLIDREGPIPERKLTSLGAEIAAGLAHAHERGIVHRDIKPQNVMLDEYGKPKLTDFGIARALDGTTNVTKTGSYLGTALYSAPEQLRGEAVTPKSDVYSLGMTLYHAATGEPPFAGSPIEVATQQMTRVPPPPRSVGARITPDTEKLILSCLAKEPDDRPASSELQDGLERAGAVGGEAGSREVRRISGRPDETVSLPTRVFQSGAIRRDRGPLIVGAVAILFVLALLLGAWYLIGGSGETTSGNGSGGGQGGQQGGNNSGGSGNGSSGGQSGGGATPPEETTGASEPTSETETEPEETQPENTAQESDSGPLPPVTEAENAVYNMYVELPFDRFDESWSYLSSRYQGEVGSVGEWERRYESVSYATVTESPQATIDGREARVTFGFDLTRPDGPESVSGTWICVNQDGEWKLDRLIEN